MGDNSQDEGKTGVISKEMEPHLYKSSPSAPISNGDKSLTDPKAAETKTEEVSKIKKHCQAEVSPVVSSKAQNNVKKVCSNKVFSVEANKENQHKSGLHPPNVPVDESKSLADVKPPSFNLYEVDTKFNGGRDKKDLEMGPLAIDDSLAEMEKDVKELKSELDRSYELLMSAAQRLESIDFKNMRERFRDNMNSAEPSSKTSVDELKHLFELNYMNNTLHSLIGQIKGDEQKKVKFDVELPGLPELTDVCRTLSEGLNLVSDTRKKCDEIKLELHEATEDTKERIKEIKKMLNTD